MLLAEELSTGEWSPGNGHRMRQTRRITRNSEIEEAGDEAQRYTVCKGTSRIM